MAANVGTAPVQFFLGASPVSAYLGATPIARTLYFTGAEDGDWGDPANWLTGELPTAADSVIATASINSNSGDPAEVVNFTMEGASLSINITVAGMATFNVSSINFFTITGNATFNATSANGGTVNGNATFTGSACNVGTITGTITGSPPFCEE